MIKARMKAHTEDSHLLPNCYITVLLKYLLINFAATEQETLCKIHEITTFIDNKLSYIKISYYE